MKKILIGGGSGFIGSALGVFLENRGFEVAILSRKTNHSTFKTFNWDYESNYIDRQSVEYADVIINLVGENVGAGRWTKNRKRKILESRIKTTQLLFDAVKNCLSPPRQIVSASAIGIYGLKNDGVKCDEGSPPGNDFLAGVVRAWEYEVLKFRELGLRTSILRLGLVLSTQGGALPKMMKPTYIGLASALGDGRQIMPWIALDDLLEMFYFVMRNERINSVYNAVAPEIINNCEFMKMLAEKMGKPFFMPPVPAFVFKVLWGEMSQILLCGRAISTDKIQDEGFEYKYLRFGSFLEKQLKSP